MSLSIEIYAAIAIESIETWRGMLVVCEFGRWTLTDEAKETRQLFVVRKYKNDRVVSSRGNVCHSIDDLPAFFGFLKGGDGFVAMWMKNGLLHRENGPAYIYGDKEAWMRDGLRWPENNRGICGAGTPKWYKFEDNHRYANNSGLNSFAEVCGDYIPPIAFVPITGLVLLDEANSFEDQIKIRAAKIILRDTLKASKIRMRGVLDRVRCAYLKDGLLHRVDGPAARGSYKSGKPINIWAINGMLHCEDGPAIEAGNTLRWFRYGVPHRVDGPVKSTAKKEEWSYMGESCSVSAAKTEENGARFCLVSIEKNCPFGCPIPWAEIKSQLRKLFWDKLDNEELEFLWKKRITAALADKK